MVAVSAEPYSSSSCYPIRRIPLFQTGQNALWALDSAEAELIEGTLRRVVEYAAGDLSEPLLRVVAAGGKRLRPALTLAVARIGSTGRPAPRAIALASAGELLHCATLIHDDLIDQAPIRRGVPTVNGREGLGAAVVGGDLLIATAVELAGSINVEAATIIADTLVGLCRGELLQGRHRYDGEVSTDVLISINAAKTGSLLRAACRLGAVAAGTQCTLGPALAQFGLHFGIALQLVDDLLDIVSTPELAGKPVQADFAAGTVTFPTALAMQRNPAIREFLRPALRPAEVAECMNLIRRSTSAISATAVTARRFALRASEALLEAAPHDAEAARLATWPLAYVDAQLVGKTDAQYRSLVSQLIGSA